MTDYVYHSSEGREYQMKNKNQEGQMGLLKTELIKMTTVLKEKVALLHSEKIFLNDDENKNNLNILSEQTYAQNLVATYIKMLNTNTFYTELSEHINDKYTAKQLSEMVSFSSDEKTEIFDAKVTTPSPNDSKLIADAVGKVAPEAISRLKSKATLKIVDYAQLPTAPSSPNEIKNVIIAMIVGLVISVGISLLRAFLDKKMRYNEEMTMIGDIPILAAIPKFDAVNKSNKKKDKRESV